MTLRRAILWSVSWVICSFAFAGFLLVWRGPDAAQIFLAGYGVEKALSLDNLMVFAAIFAYFKIPIGSQPGVLYLGFLGAALFRFLFLTTGAVLMNLHPAIGATFGAIVIGTGISMLIGSDGGSSENYESKWFVKLARKISTTPVFLCLVAIEISDIIFSFDSMPAVIAITKDPLIVYSSVMFAVLGLRSMYFVLIGLMPILTRLVWGIVAILFFVGGTLMARSAGDLVGYAPLSSIGGTPALTLGIVITCLALGAIASILWPEQETKVV